MAKVKRTLDCGCVIALDYDETLAIFYCPKHKAAPRLYEALQEARSELVELRNFPRNLRLIGQIGKALAEAEGR